MSATPLKQGDWHLILIIKKLLANKHESIQVRANETNSEVKHQFSVRNRDVLMDAKSPHKWWSTVKSAVFSLSSSLRLLVGGGMRTSVRVGWGGWSAVRSFYRQASAAQLSSISKTSHLCLQVEWGHPSLVRFWILMGVPTPSPVTYKYKYVCRYVSTFS